MGCRVALGDVCSFYRGASVPRTRMYDKGAYLYIHYGDLYKGFDLHIDVEDPAKPIPYILNNEKIKDSQRLRDQDIVYVLTSETVDDLGHAYLFNNPKEKPTISGTETTIVRVNRRDLVVPAYLNYLMSSPRFIRELRQYTRGMKVFRVHPKDVARIEIDLPQTEVQHQIVSILDAIYAKQQANSKLNGYLLELMNVQYQHSFCCNKLTLGSIYDIANVVYGAAFKSALFNEEKVGYPLIRIRDLSTFSPQYWTNEAHPKRVFVHPGDVLAGMDAEFTPCLWQGEMAVLNQRVCLFEPAANSGVSRSYLLMALNPLLTFIQNYASGTTVAHMGKSDLEALNVPIPARGDLERFNTIAEPLREQIVQNSTQNRKLAALRDALLPKLMSGEIDVSSFNFTQLNSHLAETLRQFGCYIPAIQKRGDSHSCEPPRTPGYRVIRPTGTTPLLPK